MSGLTFVTDDAAIHRAFYKRPPFKLDRNDEQELARANPVAVIRSIDLVEQVVLPALPERQAAEPLNPGLMKLTPDGVRKLASQAGTTHAAYLAAVRPAMNDHLVSLVRTLRVDECYSWRAVARFVAEVLFQRRDADVANQLAGMALCELAAAALSEDFREPPWNSFPPELWSGDDS